MPDDGGSARERKLQIGHMHAADIDIVCLDKTVAGIVDAETTQYVDCGNQHPATAAAGIVDRYDLVLIGLFLDERFVHRGSCHKFRNMIRRKELSSGFAAEIAAHEDLAEVVVEHAVVIDYGRKQSINLRENLCKAFLLVGLIGLNDLHIPFFPFVAVEMIDLI